MGWVTFGYLSITLFNFFSTGDFIAAPELHHWIFIYLLAAVSAYIAARFRNHEVGQLEALKAVDQNDLDRLILDALESKKYLQLSLTTGKIYIGQVYETIEPDVENAFLTIVPIMSGYRKEGEVAELTHRYEEIIKVLNEEDADQYPDFRLTIPKSAIVTCHYFHATIYNQVRKDQRTLST